MDLIQMFMNFVVAPSAIFTLLIFLPPYLFFKFFLYMIKSIVKEDLVGKLVLSVGSPSGIIGKFFIYMTRFIMKEAISGKVVVITGASSGIGEQLAYQYAHRGALLVLVARRKAALHEVAERARWYGSPDVLVIRADVSKVEDCKRFIDETIDYFGRLDHLVTNAGITSVNMFEESRNINTFRSVMDTNFWGSVYPTYFAVPHLRKNRGKIVVIDSVARWFPAPRMSFYNASKAAVGIFFETLRIELGSDVKITIVNPGLIESEMTKGKFLTADGTMKVDQELRDVGVGPSPVMSAESCAETILGSVCDGSRDVTVPPWYNAIYLWQMLCPEVTEWFTRLMLIPDLGTPATEALSKKILDITGAKYFLHPHSILSPEIKQD